MARLLAAAEVAPLRVAARQGDERLPAWTSLSPVSGYCVMTRSAWMPVLIGERI
jgi:hypothetical protein